MAEAISNTSPIQYLHQTGLLDLLPALFARVVVPRAVMEELAEGRGLGISLPDVTQLGRADVCEIRSPAIRPLVRDLGPGECEVLAMALERPGSRVPIDDWLARQVARSLHLPLTGTLGILLRAKQVGHIHAVRPKLDELGALGFRLDRHTRAAVLHLAGESM